MLSTQTAEQKKVPVIYYVDDWNNSLTMARAFFKNKGVIFREFHSVEDVWWEARKRKPTLAIVTTYLNDPDHYIESKRMGFPTLSVLRQTVKGINMITVGKTDRRDDDLVDSIREGALGHYIWTMDTMEYLLDRAWSLLGEDMETGGMDSELSYDERFVPAGEQPQPQVMPITALTPEMEQLKTMIYSVVRQAVEDILVERRTPPPPQTPQRMSAYSFN